MAFDDIDPRNLLRDPNGPIGGSDKTNPISDRTPDIPIISVAFLPRAIKSVAFGEIERCLMSPFDPAHFKAACGNGSGNAYHILHGVAVHAKDQLGLYPLDHNLVSAVLAALDYGRLKARGLA